MLYETNNIFAESEVRVNACELYFEASVIYMHICWPCSLNLSPFNCVTHISPKIIVVPSVYINYGLRFVRSCDFDLWHLDLKMNESSWKTIRHRPTVDSKTRNTAYSLAHVEAKNFAERSLANDAFLLFAVDCTPITTEFSSASFMTFCLWSV